MAHRNKHYGPGHAYKLNAEGTRYSLATREEKNTSIKAYCRHTSDLVVVEENQDKKVNLGKVDAGATYIDDATAVKTDKYLEGEFVYTPNNVEGVPKGLMFVVGTLDTTVPGLTPSDGNIVPGRELFIVQGTDDAVNVIGAEWARNI